MKTKIYLAPMSGVTDLPFRIICRKLGARHCFFEMLHSRAIVYNNPKNRRMMETLKGDYPISAQLVGDDPSIMLDAAQKLIALVNITFLDVNSACPAPKVARKGSGAALLKDRKKLGKIIKKLTSGLKIPVTVKLRTGFSKGDTKECVKTAMVCQDSGASTIFMHGRTASQGYSGAVDYASIKATKKALEIPVFGSGDILNPFMAKKMLDETGCDGILVARGSFGNPWIFKDIERYLKTNKAPKPPTLSMKKKVLKEHLSYVEKYKEMSPECKIGYMGKIARWYIKGFRNAASLRAHTQQVRSCKELINLIR